MFKFLESSPKDNILWDEFVESHPSGWLTSLSSWEKIIMAVSPSARVIKPVLLDKNDRIIAGLPVYLLKSPSGHYRVSSIPLATISDPLVASFEELKILLSGLELLPEFHKIRRVQIKALKTINWLEKIPLSKRQTWKYHFLCLKEPLEYIWNKLDRRSIRKSINKAIKNNLQFRLLETEEDLNIFFSLYSRTRKRLGLPSLPFIFFTSIYQLFQASGRVHFFFARYRSVDIAALMIFSFKNKFSAEALGWDRAYSRFSPSCFLYWKAIEFARATGAEYFDFGRTSPKNPGLLRFKREWGCEEKEIAELIWPSLGSTDKNISRPKKIEQAARLALKISPAFAYHLFSRLYYQYNLE